MKPLKKPEAPAPPRTPEQQKARERGLERLKELARNAPSPCKQPPPKPPIVD